MNKEGKDMKHLLLSSIIAMLASLPAFADTVTTLPNNALCNETNLGTESGSADIEVVWEPNVYRLENRYKRAQRRNRKCRKKTSGQ